MHKVIFRSIRPNTTVNFFPIDASFRQALDKEKEQGNLLEESTSIIENSTVERFVLVWNRLEDVIAFNKHPSVIDFYRRKGIYNKQHNIVINIIGETYSE